MKKLFFVSTLIFSVNTAYALILPPGFVVKQFPKTREDVNTFKIEQKVTYKNELEFSETLSVKSPNKFRVYVQKDDDAILFIREGKECMAVTAGKQIISGNLCRDINSLSYYRLLLPGHGYVAFLKSLNINVHEDNDQLVSSEQGYTKPEGIQLVRDGENPSLIIGLDDRTYNSKLSDSKSYPNIGDELIRRIKEEEPQLWLDGNTLYPTRIFGTIRDADGSSKIEILFRNYTLDANDVPMPVAMEFIRDGHKEATFALKSFDTKITIDDNFLELSNYKTKFKGGIQESSLNSTKTLLLNYLKKYR